MLAGKRKVRTIAGVALALAVIGGGAGAVVATGGDSDQPITGQALDRASKAALDHTGGGRVTETEAGDEDSYYEVEVNLDENFNVIGQEADDDGAGDQDGPNG